MNRFLIYITVITLALSLCSCAGISGPEPAEPAEPDSMPELESIVEPITGSEASAVSETVPGTEASASVPGTPGGATDAISAPDSREEPVKPAVQAPSAPLPESAAESPIGSVGGSMGESAAPELLEAVAPDRRLDCAAIEKELLRLINSLRDEAGANALGVEDSLQFAARIRAAEATESFSHTRPDGTPYNTAFDEAGFSYAGKWHGENLSSLSSSSGLPDEKEIALEMFKGLKDSPGHYRNMTETKFVQAGIGVAATYTDDSVRVASAQMFSSL